MPSKTATVSVYGDYMKTFKNILEPDRFPSMAKHWDPLILCQKPKYLTPNELKETVFNSPRIEFIISELAGSDRKRKKELENEVRNILDEIGLASSITVIRVLGQVISSVMSRICDNVFVNEERLQQVKNKVGKCPVLFLPSHRSYGDFILMSFLCFTYDIEIPAIAAGMDFHGMIGMGSALRKTGAFFMRRKYSGEQLYWKIFKEYMNKLMTSFHRAVEFFVEGTRSRSYKALPPKIGLLSMAMEPLFMGELMDVTIVPICISYEKPLEEQLFVYELLGVPKPKESTLGLLKSLSIVEQKFGSMFFDFGEPISAREYFGNQLQRSVHAVEPAKVQILSKTELSSIQDLANEVVRSQQNLAILSIFNFVSYYFIYKNFTKKSTDLEDMIDGVTNLIKLFTKLGAGVSTNTSAVREAILSTINIHKNVIAINKETGRFEIIRQPIDLRNIDESKLKGHNLSPDVMQISIPSFTFQLYINPCLHWIAQPAFMILASKQLVNEEGKPEFQLSHLKQKVHDLRSIFNQEFVFFEKSEDIDFERGLRFLLNSEIFVKPNNNNEFVLNVNNENVNVILSGIAPFICCYYQACSVILREFAVSLKPFTDQDYSIKIQQHIEKCLLIKGDHCHPYCLSLDSISLSLIAFTQNQCLSKQATDAGAGYTTNVAKTEATFDMLRQCSKLLPFEYVKLCDDLKLVAKFDQAAECGGTFVFNECVFRTTCIILFISLLVVFYFYYYPRVFPGK